MFSFENWDFGFVYSCSHALRGPPLRNWHIAGGAIDQRLAIPIYTAGLRGIPLQYVVWTDGPPDRYGAGAGEIGLVVLLVTFVTRKAVDHLGRYIVRGIRQQVANPTALLMRDSKDVIVKR